jgi:hypothetical protein
MHNAGHEDENAEKEKEKREIAHVMCDENWREKSKKRLQEARKNYKQL